MSEPTQQTEQNIRDYKAMLFTQRYNPFFWRNLYEELGGDAYWERTDPETGKVTRPPKVQIPDDHPVLKDFADFKKKLGLEGDNAVRDLFFDNNPKRFGLSAKRGDNKRLGQVFRDYDHTKQASTKESQKPREQRIISTYLRLQNFGLGFEDTKFSKFNKESGKWELPAETTYKKYLDTRKKETERLIKLGFPQDSLMGREEDVEDPRFMADFKDLQQLTETQLAETDPVKPTEIPAAAP